MQKNTIIANISILDEINLYYNLKSLLFKIQYTHTIY